MTNVSALRTEIKTWERNFRAEHGREPSVQDIKEQPGLAQKYRDYKKLSKSAEPAHSNKPSNPPSTPPRTQSRDSTHPSLLLSKPRSIAAAQPLSGYNPFSPQKNKGKQKESSPDLFSTSNPFRIARDPFPAPIPPISSTSANTSDPFAPTPNNAVSRARKRLRGEPVSPSPNKEKRRRVVPPNEESDDEDDEQSAANTSFVDDSPAKPPNGVRSFKLLFDEASAKPKFPLLRSKAAPPGLFRESSLHAESSESMDIDEVVLTSADKLTVNHTSTAQQDDPFLESAEGVKTSSSDEEMTDDRPLQEPNDAARNLLPPSPPPVTRRPSGPPHLHNGKGRGKPASDGQKKVDVSVSEDEDGSDEDAQMNGNKSRHTVRLFDRTTSRGRVRDGEDFDEDTYHFATRRPQDTEVVQTETSESISLPDTLLSILSLAPTSSQNLQNEHVVEQLLYGARRGNYDPSKGGEIWSVGELEEERDEFALDNGLRASSRATQKVYDDEDDWEGEGVPWEVGEL
ncbi:hypothetical protein B0H13DRAFT_1110291 [Mycena leptocephala]|nr:hypothetical protein B0H13DRAFT_1110291 [Mycena leptocephala]